LGGACLLGAGAALALKPRRKVSLLAPGTKLADILPHKFADWVSRDVSDFYAPDTPDSLEARLYGETVGRLFAQNTSGTEIMMLIAHGDSQSNELQLHRPEVCYPAFGLSLVESEPLQLPIAAGTTIPARRLVAQSADQKQAVIYWTRLGEFFPVSVTEQRLERLDTAMHRYVPDGVLARFSVSGPAVDASFQSLKQFIPELIMQVARNQRNVLIGTARARILSADASPLRSQIAN
jgi:EpsI family protein